MYITIDSAYERREGFGTLMSHYASLYNLALDTKLHPTIIRCKFKEQTAMEFFNQFDSQILYHENVFVNFSNVFDINSLTDIRGMHWVPADLMNMDYDQILNILLDKDINGYNLIIKWTLKSSLFSRHLDKVINELFVFDPNIVSVCKQILPQTNKQLLAVCIRNQYKHIQCPHVKLSMDYYDHAIKIFDPKSTAIIVFSDEIEEVKNLLKDKYTEYDIYYMNPTPSAIGLCTMSLCDHIITANSSFSYWASLLNKNPHKHIVCSAKFIDPRLDPILAKSLNYSWYPKNWIALDIV